MSTIPKALPEQKINTDTSQPISNDKQPPKVSDASLYGRTMIGGSRANSLLAVTEIIVRALVEKTTGAAVSPTGSARTGSGLAAPLGMALYYDSTIPNQKITIH